MTIAQLIKALKGLDPSLQVAVRDTSWNGVMHITGVYENELNGVIELEVTEAENGQ